MSVHAVISLPALPLLVAAAWLVPRQRRDFAERVGLATAPVQPGCTWVHASSLGEVAAAASLIEALAGPVLLTTDTDTGAAAARALTAGTRGRVVAQALPVDHALTLAPLWAEARPRAVVFLEGTYWPGLAALARGAKVPVVRASAKAGPRTRRFAFLQRLLPADRVIARDEHEAAFFRKFVADVVIGGDLKADRPPAVATTRWARPFVVGVSLRDGDEARLLAAWRPLRADGVGLLLAPRHPGGALPEGAVRRSSFGAVLPVEADLLVLDTTGELAGLVPQALAAVIGGSFDAAIGAHSPADASLAGVPVVAGPYGGSNEALLSACGAERVEASDLPAALARAVARPRTALARSGAGARTAAYLPSAPPAPEASPRLWLAPIVPLWSLGARLAGTLRRAEHLQVPVVLVGGQNARGGGKTSTARAVAQALSAAGHRVGVAVRGYGRARPGSDVRRSDLHREAADLGDEGVLFALDGHLVAACPDLARAAAALAADVDRIVVDDGLTAALDSVLRIEVVDARFPTARGALPAGERRPHVAAAHVTVWHHTSPAFPAPAHALIARRRPGLWRCGDAPSPLPETPVAAFAGLARPADLLSALDVPVARWRALRDHQPIDDALFDALIAWSGDLPLVTTAKDAARLTPAQRGRVYWRDEIVQIEGLSARLDSHRGDP